MDIQTEKKSAPKNHEKKQKNKFRVLIIDDDRAILNLLGEFYREHEFVAETCETAEQGLRLILEDNQTFDLIVCDLNLPEKNGIDFIQELAVTSVDTPVILITAFGTVDDAAMALKQGAYDYITKPLNFTELEVLSHRAIKIQNLEKNYEKLKQRLNDNNQIPEMIGSGPKMRELLVLINKVANSSSNILINGESGSGKEMVAQAVHDKSKRRDKPFVPINCSAIPGDLLEAELFGYKKGAFTGANEDRKGLFEEANGGTLFLDEIGDMPLSLQSKVLRAIQERKIKPLGETQQRTIDVRILAATHKDLKTLIKKNEFREDLYFRLCVIPINVPPLRNRREDIPILANHFLKKYAAANDKKIQGISHEALAKLKRLRWTGNVRELENTIERAVVLSTENQIAEKDITIEGSIEVDEQTSLLFKELLPLKELEKQYIQFVLDKTEGKKEEAAEILGINRKTLYRKEKEYGF